MRLAVENLRVTLGGREILGGVSCAVAEGEWWMLIGPNGAGKSTLVQAVSGAVPSEGALTLDGESLRAMRPARRARLIGVMDQRQEGVPDFTAREIVAMGRYPHRAGFLRHTDPEGETAVDRAMEATGVTAMAGQSYATLSGGERQRVLLAQALCLDPRILVLDEPGNHLDLSQLRQLFLLIDRWRQQPGRAVITVVHDLTLARAFGTHALLLSHGQTVACGAIGDVMRPEHLDAVWEMDVGEWMRACYGQWAR